MNWCWNKLQNYTLCNEWKAFIWRHIQFVHYGKLHMRYSGQFNWTIGSSIWNDGNTTTSTIPNFHTLFFHPQVEQFFPNWAVDTAPKLGSGYIVTYTVWKFHDFSVVQILREINFGESWSSKIAFFAVLGALNYIDFVNFSFQKVQNIRNCGNWVSKYLKMVSRVWDSKIPKISFM